MSQNNRAKKTQSDSTQAAMAATTTTITLAAVWCLLLTASLVLSQDPPPSLILPASYAGEVLDQTSCPSDGQRSVFDTDSDTTLRQLVQDQVFPAFSTTAGQSESFPANSCPDVSVRLPSGNFWISLPSGQVSQLYCDNNERDCCGQQGGWQRVANLDMNDTTQSCPGDWVLNTSGGIRGCTVNTGGSCGGCVSATFPTNAIPYNRVCGRVLGFQNGAPDAFAPYTRCLENGNIDSAYVDGVSITYGSPRQHVWTLANGLTQGTSGTSLCPCAVADNTFEIIIPPFVGDDYFCDTATTDAAPSGLYANNPLWEGEGCVSPSTCCAFNKPPYFCKELPQSSTEDIEVRLCRDDTNGGAVLNFIEMYVTEF